MIDHKRLTSAESRMFRLILSGLFAMAGFVILVSLFVRIFPAPVKGHAVALVSQETTVSAPATTKTAPSATAVPLPPVETTVPEAPQTPTQVPQTTTPEPTPTASVPAPISEDSPEWRCDTMGNRVCGVPDGTGTFVLICHDFTGYPIRVVYDPNTCA